MSLPYRPDEQPACINAIQKASLRVSSPQLLILTFIPVFAMGAPFVL